MPCPPVNATGLRRAALLNDLSCFGKCSLTVGLPVLAAAGVEAALLPTAVLSTHTGGFDGYTCQPLTAELDKILAHWGTLGLHLDAIATGYFCGAGQLVLAERLLAQFATPDTLTLVDPVMADGGRLYPGFDEGFVGVMRRLCAGAEVISPNLTEAFLLAEMPYAPTPDAATLRRCLDRLLALGARRVIITGVRRQPGADWAAFDAHCVAPTPDGTQQIGCLCAGDGAPFAVWHPFAQTALHGCGDVFSAAFLAAALGMRPAHGDPAAARPTGATPQQDAPSETALPPCAWADDADWFAFAVRAAAHFTHRCVQATVQARYPGHWYGLRLEACLAEGFWQGVT